MGMYDSVIVKCPKCETEHQFQSKSGLCLLDVDCPDDVMSNVNRHSPYLCNCGVLIEVDIKSRKVIIVSDAS